MRISFTAYTFDCTVEGEVELTRPRLSDQLNEDESLLVLDATLRSLDDGSIVTIESMELEREAIYAIQAPDPRGATTRRVHTVRHRKGATVGPYTLLGMLHERPGVTPLGALRLTRPFVAFTDATIAFVRAGHVEMRDSKTLIVNGRRVDWLGDALAAAARIAMDRESTELAQPA
jgi:hypothetical protein